MGMAQLSLGSRGEMKHGGIQDPGALVPMHQLLVQGGSLRRQLIQQAIQQILGEARGADAAEQLEAWARAERQIVDLIAQVPTDEQLTRLAVHDAADLSEADQGLKAA